MTPWRHPADETAHDIVVYTDSSTLPHALMSRLESRAGMTLTKPLSALGGIDREANLSRIGEIVVDLRDASVEAELRALRGRANGTRIIGLGDDSTLEFYRRAKRAGCDEYFVIDQELPMAVDYIVGQDKADRPGDIVVHGVKLGIGASLISAGLAQFLSGTRSVEIVDMNWTHPTVNYWLGEDRTGELHRLCGHGDRIDELMTNQIALRLNKEIRYYGGYDITGSSRFVPADAAKFFDVISANDACTIWKTDKGNPEFSSHVLRHADHVVLVSDRGLPSLRAVNDMIASCSESGRRPTVVINDPYAESDIRVAKFRSLLQSEDVIAIPKVRRLKAQLLDGIPPGSRRSRLHRHIRKIAARLGPQHRPARGWRPRR